MKMFLKLILIAAPLFFATGCRKELCYDHDKHSLARRVAIAPTFEMEWERDYGINWPAKWDAAGFGIDYDALRPGMPKGIAVLVFNEDATVDKEMHIAATGETVLLTEGAHRLLMFNDDTYNIIIDDMASLPTARATTRSRSRASYAQFHANEETVGPPDMLYGHYEPHIEPELSTGSTVYDCELRPLVYTYLIRYVIDEGSEYVASARGALAGMARHVFLSDGHTGDEAATVLFECETTDYGAEARLMSFGVPGFPDRYYDRSGWHVPDDGSHYTLNLELRLTTGQSYTLDFDVTGQVALQPRGGVITVNDIRIVTGPSVGDGAFDVNVGGWGPAEEIPLN